jgi:lysophospholipase L1-like esterase
MGAALLAAGCGGDGEGERACEPPTVVAFGDSITFGDGADRGESYPDVLGRRVGSRARVVNAGIPANRLLRDGGQDATPVEAGPRALDRLGEVLRQPRAADAIVLEGINDLEITGASAGAVIAALREVGQRLEAADVDVLLGTLPPTGGGPSGWNSPDLDARRQRVNAWIRRQRGRVVDFDAALRDPADPARLRAGFDSGDGVHPNAAGYRAMAEAVPMRKLADKGECG